MPKRSWNLNTVYISERLQECLRPISRCALTTVVAPMGYGKTTAVNWYLLERAKLDEAAVVRISVYSDNLAIFWKSVQEAFSHAGFDFLRAYPCPDDAAGGSLLTDDLCHALAGKRPCYIFIDDFHLLTDNRVPAFLCTLTNRLPENVHLIVASRDRFLPAEEILRLGGRLYTVGAEQLRLNHTELSIYAHRCGTVLSDAQIESLLYSSEGWFSAIYLNLRTLHERGRAAKPQLGYLRDVLRRDDRPAAVKAARIFGRHGSCGRIHRRDGRNRHWQQKHRCDLTDVDRAERLCQAPAGRRDVPLPPHDERLRRAHVPHDGAAAAGSLPQ